MQIVLAPLEGITGYVYRNAHHKVYGGVDQYYMPFISPNGKHMLLTRDREDVAPEHNEGMNVVPQILTNRSDFFLRTAKYLQECGYQEVNLNLGCPSGTVVAKGKGAGFLRDLMGLDQFLYDIYSQCPIDISIKTRVGVKSPDEIEEILSIYNRYPVKELIVHSRVRDDFYKGKPRMDAFEYVLRESKAPVCYNGDLFTKEDVLGFM